MPKLIMLVGPPGAGKSTLAEQLEEEFNKKRMGANCLPTSARVSQDDLGKSGHLDLFNLLLAKGDDIIIDRMNFSVGQRRRYLDPAKAEGYETVIIVVHESYDTCLARCLKRENHPTIKDEDNAKSALHTFFSKYERVEDSEADKVVRIWPEGEKPYAILCDLDGTLANIDHRLYHVKGEKRNWKKFFEEIPNDNVNWWCAEILENLPYKVVYCSGRPDDHKKVTEKWLWETHSLPIGDLFMRRRNDFRRDDTVKEIIFEFEIKTRYVPYFVIDDRAQVVKMWRKHGLTCLACADGDF